MVFTLDSLTVTLEPETNGTRIKCSTWDVILPELPAETVRELVTNNYQVLKKHYQPENNDVVPAAALDAVCFKLMLYYLERYNGWRVNYKDEKNRKLTFLERDLNDTYNADMMYDYFRPLYPDNYAAMCIQLLKVTPEWFEALISRKDMLADK